ncbi:hypothetical protein N657DRAFT_357779 [Parathielavia appendiculata]|uniref:CENP-V/GFA domain-containing protein n=1 Tax=Parathielavia appendiculata TaxID=2587402 RepID=A0AAN6Z4C5_9PEZI|nr:hypothetical protein N657DRAFT_357779 [Parathielavia appendiculata]
MDAARNITISCHCGAARQTLLPKEHNDLFSQVSFCHCDTCRHSTGLLCTSYAPVASHPPPSLTGLQSHSTSSTSTRYFCSTCGCHVFRAKHASTLSFPAEWDWEVATGVITDAPESRLPEQWHHHHVQDTQDGGLSPFLLASSPPRPSQSPPSVDDDILQASCHCTSISLQITPPSPDPKDNPDSPYPDLLLPYHSTPPHTVSNPSNEKWYLRLVPSSSSSTSKQEEVYLPDDTAQQQQNPTRSPKTETKTRYLSGTCACQPCRLTSGFEIQTWAFIPRRNISISIPHSSSSSSNPDQPAWAKYQPLDFTNLPANLPLSTYESSPGRKREFCAVCGATIFWHDDFRPDLIDVSVGLFRPSANSGGGARAENWLEWWTERVSFSEDASKGRTGEAKTWGEGVIRLLEEGLRTRRVGQPAKEH